MRNSAVAWFRRQARDRKSPGRLLLVTLLIVGGLSALTPAAGAAQAVPPDDPGRGMRWGGLVAGNQRGCGGAYEIRGKADEVLGCTHGPDPAPAQVDVRKPVSADTLIRIAGALPKPPPGPATNGDGIACVGDGTSGYRIEAIYASVRGSDDRYGAVLPTLQSSYAPYMEWQYRTSAAETGGVARLRFVTAANGTSCTVVVRHEILSTSADDSFSNTISELKARGYNRSDRRYLVWMDSNVLCGIGQIFTDNQPGQNNANNGHSPAFARADTGCWGYAESHEIMHSLGGVQPGAPHATPGFHCWDENDEMCYDDDGPGPVVMQSRCPARDGRLLDCNHDDYFYAGSPPAGTYLSTHWNTYNSRFLVPGVLAGDEKYVAGDFNADGKSDVTTFLNNRNATTSAYLFASNGTRLAPAASWASCAGCWDTTRATYVAGDFNADGKSDVMALYNYGSATTKAWLFASNGTRLAPAVSWESCAGCWDTTRATYVAGDFNADGKSDVTAFYNYGGATTKAWFFASTGRTLSPALAWEPA